jgi:6-phosphofructokinase 1
VQHTGAEIRVTILGHVQRGGTPSPRDRLLASSFGVHAVDLVAQGRFSRMVAWRESGVIDVPLHEVTIGARGVDPNDPLIATARALGIHLGEQRANPRT